MTTDQQHTVMGMPMLTTPMDEMGQDIRAWTIRLREGATATLRDGYTGHVTGSSNPSISHGARVEIQDLHWGDGICWACVVVLESKDPDQVGCVAVLPIGRLKVEVVS